MIQSPLLPKENNWCSGQSLAACTKVLSSLRRLEDAGPDPADWNLHVLCEMGLALTPQLATCLGNAPPTSAMPLPGPVPIPVRLFRHSEPLSTGVHLSGAASAAALVEAPATFLSDWVLRTEAASTGVGVPVACVHLQR